MSSRHPILKVLALATLSTTLFAQTEPALIERDMYQQRLESTRQIKALDDSIFGDVIELQNGGLSFEVTDVALPGNNALAVAFGRQYTVVNSRTDNNNHILADWRPTLPRMHGTFAPIWNALDGSRNRCSSLTPPRIVDDANSGRFLQGSYFNGVKVEIPGEVSGELLITAPGISRPAPENNLPFQWTVDGQTHLRCLPNAATDGGEGFLAVTPNGNRYWFTKIISRSLPPVEGPPNGVNGNYRLERSEVSLYATRVEDRHGNWVTYTYGGTHNNIAYGPDQLAVIDSSDQRRITITYASGRVATVSAGEQPDSPGPRVWTYTYNANGTRLERVQLPDTSAWLYGFSQLSSAPIKPQSGGDDGDCWGPGTPDPTTSPRSGTVTHPSGATATYTIAITRHARNQVTLSCTNFTMPVGQNDPRDDVNLWPNQFDAWSVVQKHVTGTGLDPQTWSYDYTEKESYEFVIFKGVNNEPPYFCPTTGPNADPRCDQPQCTDDWCINALGSRTTITRPDGTRVIHSFGNSWQFDDGKLRFTEVRDPEGNVVESTHHSYLWANKEGDGYPYDSFGVTLQQAHEGFQSEYHRPRYQTYTLRDGTGFVETSWATGAGSAFAIDPLGRPLRVRRYAELAAFPYQTPSHVTAYTYHDVSSPWVLGQISRITVNDIETHRAEFYGANALPWKTYKGGILRQELFYDLPGGAATATTGTVSKFKNGRTFETNLLGWVRGIPTTVLDANNRSTVTGVDGNGWIRSIRNELNHTTGYAYDGLGRLNLVDPPFRVRPPGTPDWAVENLGWSKVPAGSFLAGYWLRTSTHGNQITETFLDSYYRPVVVRQRDLLSTVGPRSTVYRYDSMNRKVFESHALNATQLPATEAGIRALTAGTHYAYDALGRVTSQSVETEESGARATTSISFLSELRKRVTDPENHSTTFYYESANDANLERPTRIEAPESQITTFTRNAFGNPTRISRTSTYAGESLTVHRDFVYDQAQRLCKRIDPESGVSIYYYDAENNLEWSAHGLLGTNYTSATSCSYSAVPQNRKIAKQYDRLNRLTRTDFPVPSDPQTPPTPFTAFTYRDDGTLNTAERDGSKWTYLYNELALRERETLEFDNLTWVFDPSYTATGKLTTLEYSGTNQPSELVAFQPNAYGEPTTVGNYLSGAQYHANGSLQTAAFANGVSTRRELNHRRLPSLLEYSLSGSVVFGAEYYYDGSANITQVTGSRASSYLYDGLNRLTFASQHVPGSGMPGSQAFHYDQLDNLRRSVSSTEDLAFNLDPSTGRMSSVSNGPGGPILLDIGYDTRGNLISGSTGAFSYPVTFDESAYVTSVVTPGGVNESYRYDAFGHRTKKVSSAVGVVYSVYTSDGLLRAERDHQGVKRHYYLGNQLVARNGAFGGGLGTTTWFVTDHLGSNVRTFGAFPTPTGGEQSYFSPYGVRPIKTTEIGPAFAGHYEDSSSYTYMKARYYNPSVGRFLSPDPVDVDPTTGANFNRYWYASNNPIAFIDPDGRRDVFIGGAMDKNRSRIVQDYAANQKGSNPGRDVRYFSHREKGKIAAAINAPLADGEPLNVIGHSLGGREAIRQANSTGAKITNLVTIDPVGGAGDGSKPANVDTWTDVTAVPTKKNMSDRVAGTGRKLMGTTETSGADVSRTMATNHGDFEYMMSSSGAQQQVDASYDQKELKDPQ